MREVEATAWRVGELAGRTGLSVRTLHYYDEIGLLSPSFRSESGYRLYVAEDVERLQRIKSLRQLGLALKEIRGVLGNPELSPEGIIRAHMSRLEKEIEARKNLHERLSNIAEILKSTMEVSAEELIDTIEVIVMSENIEKHYSPEQLDYLAKRREDIGEERIKEVEAEWPRLIQEVQAEMDRGTPPEDPKARKLAERWMGLVEEFTGGDPGIQRSLDNMWNDEKQTRDMRMDNIQPMFDYISRAQNATRDEE